MFHVPEYYHDLSLKLSEALDDIGVNETMVMTQRKAMLLNETMHTVTASDMFKIFMYNFGSLSEGTTTIGLTSDCDNLLCSKKAIVIQDFAEWQPGLLNLMMVKDENTPPGYCQLQLIRSDLPLPQLRVQDEHCVKVSSDIVLIKNTAVKCHYKEKHGPSNVRIGIPGHRDQDVVPAFPCLSWPKEARQWFHRDASIWPTQEIKNFAKKGVCFVFPVGSKVGQNEAIEWRISTSLAERSLMFSLNITQIRCYILMKMILKTYLNSYLSSFMCKTVILFCIENTQPKLWEEFNLMKCLSHCLQRLYICLIERNCPHFIIHKNNLMAKKFSVQVKHKLQEKMCHIIESLAHLLFGIQIDDLGRRLQNKLNLLRHPMHTHTYSRYEISICIPISCLWQTTAYIIHLNNVMLNESSNDSSGLIQQRLLKRLQMLIKVYRNGNRLEQTASSLLTPQICSKLGTIKASLNLQARNAVSSDTIGLLYAGGHSDVLSGRLKLASVLYSMGDMINTEIILRESEIMYHRQEVEAHCRCHSSLYLNYPKRQFAEETFLKDIVSFIRENIAFCVRFIPIEINCVPQELQYEMFRSAQDDFLHGGIDNDYWMKCAVVDSLPYLYFLQYKTYGQLQRVVNQQQALTNMMVSIEIGEELGHRESALNLLGQCMEKENRIHDALKCYISSLAIRNRNNVAGIHICKLLANIMNHGRHQM